ncbi:MAG: CPBP family intramembrane metalloprotease [Clostridiales bacterium]|jgi:membrane protease YdiL (CAAX protease family)|nr:CPBP family intramembrane metalloprotease [Clostridiales bacterium]
MLLDEVIRAVIASALFAAIPLVWWLITARTEESFFAYIGIKRMTVKKKTVFFVPLFLTVILVALMPLVLDPLLPTDIQSANARFAGRGARAVLPIIVFAFFATALPEEILFRGFLGKYLSKRFGFVAGNTAQAVIFGLLHGADMFAALGSWVPMLVIALTAAFGWLTGFVDEKSDGSIIPGIVLPDCRTYTPL